jgi:hypothetical protein
MKRKIFISFTESAHDDLEIAQWIEAEARNMGFTVYSQLTDDVLPSDLFMWLEEQIKACDVFIAIWSKPYINGQISEYERTVLLSIDPNLKSRVLLGIRMDDVEIPPRFRRGPYVDALLHKARAKEKVLRHLRFLADRPSGRPDLSSELAPAKVLGSRLAGSRRPANDRQTASSTAERLPSPAPGRIAPDFEGFFDELDKAEITTPTLSDSVILPVREPKFMVFRRGDRYILAILDSKATVRPSNLRKTSEPEKIRTGYFIVFMLMGRCFFRRCTFRTAKSCYRAAALMES